MDNLAKQLFEDYKYYRYHTANYRKAKLANPYLNELKSTSQRISLMRHMIDWCQRRAISPRLWMYSLFVSRRWIYAPRLETAHLLSVKHFPKFKSLKDFSFYRKYQQSIMDSKVSTAVFDPNRDLCSTAEQAKRYYLSVNRARDCMDRMSDETYGYHPKSKVCGYCPIACECKARLESAVSFDIMALRNDRITSEAANQIALARVQAYGR